MNNVICHTEYFTMIGYNVRIAPIAFLVSWIICGTKNKTTFLRKENLRRRLIGYEHYDYLSRL